MLSCIGWAVRFRSLARENERFASSLQQIHFLVFAILMLTEANGPNMLSST